MAVFVVIYRATNNTEVAFVTINIFYYSSDYILSVQFFYIIFIDFYVYVLCMYCAFCSE